MVLIISFVIAVCLSATFLGLFIDLPHLIVLIIIISAGGPMFSVSVYTYQFAAEVTYPVSEIQAISCINVLNKLLSFGMAQLSSFLSK